MTMTKRTMESASSPTAAQGIRRASNTDLSTFLKKKWGSREDMSKTNSFHTEGPSVSTAASTNETFVPRMSIPKSAEATPVSAPPERLTALWGAMNEETRSTLMKNLQAQLADPKKVETEGHSRQPATKRMFFNSIQKMPSNDSQSEKADVVGPLPEMVAHATTDSPGEQTLSFSGDSMKSLLQRKVAANKMNDFGQRDNSKYHASMRMAPKPAALSTSQSHCNFSTKRLQRRTSSSTMKKCVSFEENPVQSVQAIDMCESELKNSVWYSDQEYTGMKNSIKRVLREQKSGAFQETDSSTMHGLEIFLNRRELKAKRKEAIDAVIFEQARQRIKRIPSDPMLLAEAYQRKLGGYGSKSCSNLFTNNLEGLGTQVHRSSSYSVDMVQAGSAMQNAVWGAPGTCHAPEKDLTATKNSASELRMKFMQSVA